MALKFRNHTIVKAVEIEVVKKRGSNKKAKIYKFKEWFIPKCNRYNKRKIKLFLFMSLSWLYVVNVIDYRFYKITFPLTLHITIFLIWKKLINEKIDLKSSQFYTPK